MSLRCHSCAQTLDLTSIVRDNDIIRLHVSESPGDSWGAAGARQERGTVEVARKGIVVGRCWSLCWTHLQMFSVSTVLGEKAANVGSPEEHLPSFLAVAHHHDGEEEDN